MQNERQVHSLGGRQSGDRGTLKITPLSYLGSCLASQVQVQAIPAASLPLGTLGTGLSSSESAHRINC